MCKKPTVYHVFLKYRKKDDEKYEENVNYQKNLLTLKQL